MFKNENVFDVSSCKARNFYLYIYYLFNAVCWCSKPEGIT